MSNSTAKLRRYVDMWALPGAHATNISLLQRLKKADTQHFTSNMDVVGSVSELDEKANCWEKTHLVGVRTDIWQPDKKELASSLKALKKKRQAKLKQEIKRSGRLNSEQKDQLDEQLAQDGVMQLEAGDIEKRRLVLKLFKVTGKRVRWCGTIEEVTTAEIHNSIGSKRALLTTAVMLPGTEFVAQVQQNHRTLRPPAVFTFCYYDEERMWHLSLKQRWFSLGIDFDVHADGANLGKLDGQLVTFGSDSYVDLQDHALTSDTQFVDLLTLFTASVGYHRAMRRSIRRRVKAILSGQSHRHVIEGAEIRLRHNGRAAA